MREEFSSMLIYMGTQERKMHFFMDVAIKVSKQELMVHIVTYFQGAITQQVQIHQIITSKEFTPDKGKL